MRLYEICIQMNYADQLKEAPSLWNRKTSKAILIKFNQLQYLYKYSHTFFFFSTVLIQKKFGFFNCKKSKPRNTLYISFQTKDRRMKA